MPCCKVLSEHIDMKSKHTQTGWRICRLLIAVTCGLIVFAAKTHADLKFAELFKTNCILQRDAPLNVYGSGAAPGSSVTVQYSRQGLTETATATAGDGGEWLVVLPSLPASFEPATLKVSADGDSKTVSNVLVGEVWLAAGQSNMQMPFDWLPKAVKAERMQSINEPYIRFAKTAPYFSDTPQEDYPYGPKVNKVVWPSGSYEEKGVHRVRYMPMVSFYFAQELYRELNVPIGIIAVAYSGTRIRSWMTEEAIEVAAPAALNNPGTGANQPAGCYNRMIHPARNYTIRGVIWYQGEDDTKIDSAGDRPDQYRKLFPALIRSWRSIFKNPDMPFYFVQLCQFNQSGSHDWPALRSAQQMGLSEPNTGMAVTIDSGNPKNIHPTDKEIPGERLARLALKRTYGKSSIIDSGPFFSRADYNSDGTVRIHFTDIADGLVGDATLNGFELAGADGRYHQAVASIDSKTNTVVLSSTDVSTPESVRYAWKSHFSDANPLTLKNSAGLPAAPFQTQKSEG